MQKLFLDDYEIVVTCKCCRKREAIYGTRCKICTHANDNKKARMPKRNSTATRDEWTRKILTASSGLRHRSKTKPATNTELRSLLEAQSYRCWFTGSELKPDRSTELGHLTSIRNGGAFDISNLAWIRRDINRMMATLGAEEFIFICRDISRRHEAKNEALGLPPGAGVLARPDP